MKNIHPKFNGSIRAGKLKVDQPEQFEAYLFTMPEKVEVIVRPITRNTSRSNEQNKYYWAVVIKLISEEQGSSAEEVHEILKQQFLSKEISMGGRVFNVPKYSTTELTTAQFEEFLSNVRQWASINLGVYIPLPNEIDYQEE